jgi:hypothetical protein
MAIDTRERERREDGQLHREDAVFDVIGAVLCVVGVLAMANLVGLA